MDELLVGLLMQAWTTLNSKTLASTALPQEVVFASPSPQSKLNTKPAVKSVQTSRINKVQILKALNEYRSKNGIAALTIDEKLQNYAESRSNYLMTLGKLDKHSGHKEFMNNNGFEKLGFNSVAENQSWNNQGSAEQLISEFYAKSSGHNKNQLNPEYTHVGIGINGAFTNIVFGGRRS